MKRLDCEQYSADWWEARRGIPTASEFGRIITPKTGALSARADEYSAELIVDTVQEPEEIHFQSYWMERGSLLEPEAADWYEFRFGIELEQIGILLNHGAGYSPDRLAGKGAVEFKCPKPSTHVKWCLRGGLPDEHRPQVHGGLHIGGLDWIDFVSYCPGFRPLVVRVEPDSYTTKVESALSDFVVRLDTARRQILGDEVREAA